MLHNYSLSTTDETRDIIFIENPLKNNLCQTFPPGFAGWSFYQKITLHTKRKRDGERFFLLFQISISSKLSYSNFLKQFRNAESRELNKLSAVQFMEVWDHYDNDRKDDSLWRSETIMIIMVRMRV